MRTLALAAMLCFATGEAFAFDCSRMGDPSYLQRYAESYSHDALTEGLTKCLQPARRGTAKTRPTSPPPPKRKVPQVGRHCLEMDQPYSGMVGFWVNNCNYGVTVRWYHKTGIGLAWVKPYGRNTATVGPTAGVKSWDTCRSDRPYQVTPKRLPSGRYRCE